MAQNMLWSLFSPWSQTIDKFVNNPVTSWQRFFNPQVVFNYNPQDEPIEAHVLSKVGSYGSQLSTLIDTIALLTPLVDRKGLDTEQKKALVEFDALRSKAQEAVDEARGLLGADAIIEAARRLRERNSADAERIAPAVQAALKGE